MDQPSKPIQKSFPKWLRITLIVIASLFLLLLIAWGIIAYYFQVNKKPLLKRINITASESINGKVTIGDMDVVFWKEMPSISIRLKDVLVTDSLYDQHKKPLLKSEEVYLKVKMRSLLTDHIEFEKITVTKGIFHFFVDENEYSNRYLLKGNPNKKKKNKKEFDFSLFRIQDFKLLYEYIPRDKKFDIDIKDWDGKVEEKNNVLHIDAPLDAFVHMLGFKLEKGAYMVNKSLKSDLHLTFNKNTKVLHMPLQPTNMDGEDVRLGLTFRFKDSPVSYNVTIEDDQILVSKGASFLNRHIAKNFDKIDARKPIYVKTIIDGWMKYPDTPIVSVHWRTTNNEIVTKYGTIDSAAMEGLFYNYFEEGKGHGDPNSIIYLTQLTGVYNGIPFIADSVFVRNFKVPRLIATISSEFPVSSINSIVGKSLFFYAGGADFKFKFDGIVDPKIEGYRSLNGYFKIHNAKMKYLPRGFVVDDVDFDLTMRERDVIMNSVHFRNGKSNIFLDGIAKNFLSPFFNMPGKVTVDWNMKSKLIDLNDFRPFLVPRQAKAARNSNNSPIQNINNTLEDLLDQANMLVNIKVDKVVYDKFEANLLRADMDLLSKSINLNKIYFQHAGGSLNLAMTVNQTMVNNPFSIKGKINSVEVNKFFYGMNNFGMTTLTDKNLKGSLTADIDLKGKITDKGNLLERSLNGNANFILENGELNDFAPIKQIQKYVFKKRDLDHIRFKDIKNNFIIDDGKIIIMPMAIESSALNIYTKGIYSFHQGTDLSIEIPIRNPQKDSIRIAEGKEPRKKSGLKVYLRARDNEEGGVSIKWDPLKKGDKAIDEKLDLDEDGELKDEEEINIPQHQSDVKTEDDKIIEKNIPKKEENEPFQNEEEIPQKNPNAQDKKEDAKWWKFW